MSRSSRMILITVEVLLALGLVARLVVADPTPARAQRQGAVVREDAAVREGAVVREDADVREDGEGAAVVTDDVPRVVLLAGDSILRQTGPALTDSFGQGVTVVNEGVNGSGLLTPGILDWVEQLRRLVEEEDPDVVVLMFVGNYTDTDFWTTAEGQPVLHNTLAFYAAWAQRADRLMQDLESSDADIYWVLPPPEYTELNKEITRGLRQVYVDLAQRWPRINLIDAYQALAGPDATYLSSITRPDGEVVPLRAPDTVHLTEEGARRLAGTIHQQVDPSR